jgi:hypothetical protein
MISKHSNMNDIVIGLVRHREWWQCGKCVFILKYKQYTKLSSKLYKGNVLFSKVNKICYFNDKEPFWVSASDNMSQ